MTTGEDSEPATALAIFNRFSRRLVALARTRLDQQTRQKIDPEDVVQSVFRSFFTRRDAGQIETDGWEDLWRVLVVFTVRKCARKAKSFRTAQRDVRREVGLPWHPGDGDGDGWQLVDREPSPEEVAALVETMDQLLLGASDVERAIILARLDGYGPREISEQMAGVSERRVYRVLTQVRKKLEAADSSARSR